MLTPQEVIAIRRVADKDWNYTKLPVETQHKVADHFKDTGEMPYTVAKARNAEPSVWIELQLRTMNRHALEMWLIRDSGLLQSKPKQTFKQFMNPEPA